MFSVEMTAVAKNTCLLSGDFKFPVWTGNDISIICIENRLCHHERDNFCAAVWGKTIDHAGFPYSGLFFSSRKKKKCKRCWMAKIYFCPNYNYLHLYFGCKNVTPCLRQWIACVRRSVSGDERPPPFFLACVASVPVRGFVNERVRTGMLAWHRLYNVVL